MLLQAPGDVERVKKTVDVSASIEFFHRLERGGVS